VGSGRRKGSEGVEGVEGVETQATFVRPSSSPRTIHFRLTADSQLLVASVRVRTRCTVSNENACSGKMRGPRCPFGVVSEPAGDGNVPWLV
jgi:hypothetical protein